MTTLYNCKSEIDAAGAKRFRITKFNDDMEVESSYLTDGASCECPAGERPTCRHRQMLPKFLARNAVNTLWFLDYDRGGWVQSELEVEFDDIRAQRVEQDEAVDLSKPPAGVTILDLSKTSPETLFNTLADALEEPRMENHPFSGKIERRGF